MKNNPIRPQTTWTVAILMAATVVTSGGCAKLFHMMHYNHLSGHVQDHHMAYYHSAHTGRIIPKEHHKNCLVEPPCFGYEPTCWHRWPEECGRCPVEEVIMDVPYSEAHPSSAATPAEVVAPMEGEGAIPPAGSDPIDTDLPDVTQPFDPEIDPIEDPEIPDLTLPDGVDARPPSPPMTRAVPTRRSPPAPRKTPRSSAPKSRTSVAHQTAPKPSVPQPAIERRVVSGQAESSAASRLQKAPLVVVDEDAPPTVLPDTAVQELAEEAAEISLAWDGRESIAVASIGPATVTPAPFDVPIARVTDISRQPIETVKPTAQVARTPPPSKPAHRRLSVAKRPTPKPEQVATKPRLEPQRAKPAAPVVAPKKTPAPSRAAARLASKPPLLPETAQPAKTVATSKPTFDSKPDAKVASNPDVKVEADVAKSAPTTARPSVVAPRKTETKVAATPPAAVDPSKVSSRRRRPRTRRQPTRQPTRQAPIVVARTATSPVEPKPEPVIPTFKITPVLPNQTLIGPSPLRIVDGSGPQNVIRFVSDQQESASQPVTADAGAADLRFR